MEYINSTILAQIFNLAALFSIIYIVYRVIKNSIIKEQLRRKHEESVISKLDTLIELNRKLLDYTTNNKNSN